MTPDTKGERFARRFDAKWEDDPATGCWIWTGSTNGKGYGRVMAGSRRQYTHRLAYERWVGPIPDGHEIHHDCETKLCVNPDHLRAMTRAEHLSIHWDGFCKRGHELTPGNTYIRSSGIRPGERQCRACKRRRDREYLSRKRARAYRSTQAATEAPAAP